MKLNILGTGNAAVIHCYNTCFTMEEQGEHILVDAGGGNGILKILDGQEHPPYKYSSYYYDTRTY